MDPIEQVLEFIQTPGEKAFGRPEAPDRPLVTLSFAQSLDGSLTHRRGLSLALSGTESLELTHRLRAAHQAILVGIGTVLADDPQLNVRLAPGAHPQPVILDSLLRIPLHSQLLRPKSGPRESPVWIATTTRADPDRATALQFAGANLIELAPDAHGRVPLPEVLAYLRAAGIENLMVEGGARVLQAFLAARLADRVVITLCPQFVGGLKALREPLTGVPTAEDEAQQLSASHFPRLESMHAAGLGEDLIVWGKICYPPH